jgi:hypothetical protein
MARIQHLNGCLRPLGRVSTAEPAKDPLLSLAEPETSNYALRHPAQPRRARQKQGPERLPSSASHLRIATAFTGERSSTFEKLRSGKKPVSGPDIRTTTGTRRQNRGTFKCGRFLIRRLRMRKCMLVAVLAAFACCSALMLASLFAPTLARDNGQWKDIDPKVRQWFREQKSPQTGGVLLQ